MKICFFGTYDRNFTSNKIVLNGLRSNGAQVIEVNAHIPVTHLDSKSDMTTLKLIKRVLLKWKILKEIWIHWRDFRECDYIYVGYPGHFDVIIAYPIAKLLRKKLVFNPLVIFYTGFVDDQGILDKNSLLAKVVKFGEKMIYQMCNLIIADTQLQLDHLVSEFGINPSKIKVVAIGADNNIYKKIPKVGSQKMFNIIYYGLYSPLHGVEHILDAAEICKCDNHIKFLMIGKGNTYESCTKSAKSRMLDNIIFYPDMNESNAFKTLATGDIFLGFLQAHPSVERIVPNKVYQGLAMGKAVISGDTPAMRESFIHKQDVYLCKLADGADLAKAIKFLKDHPTLTKKIAETGYKKYKSRYTPEIIGKILIKSFKGA